MARDRRPEFSANSQFFIMFYPKFALDSNYTVFGRVIGGMDYVDAIERGEPPANPTKILQASLASQNKPLPVFPPQPVAPAQPAALTAPPSDEQSPAPEPSASPEPLPDTTPAPAAPTGRRHRRGGGMGGGMGGPYGQ